MASKPLVAVLDACVLYPFHLRNLLVQAAFDGHWPMPTVRSVRRQSIPPPLRATMLRLLRLPFPRSLRVENSRNPIGSGAMLISPILFIFLDQPCSVALRAGLDHAGFGASPIV